MDGVALSINSRILVNGQTNPTQNGLYLVQTVGAGPTGTWVRTTDADSAGEMQAGMVVTVTEGNTYRDTLWTLTTDDPIVLGDSEITFQQSTSFSFGNISANGTAILANTVGDGVTFTAGENITIVGNATAKTVTIGVTGIETSEISNGTSTVAIATANGNVTVSVDGTSNVAVFTAAGANITGTIEASGNITGAYFIGNGSQLTGLPEQYGNANVAAYLPTYTGNIGAGNITATGNVSANYFLGNGSQLSGIITSVANINNGTSNVSINAANANVTVGVNGTGNVAVFAASGVTVTGNILPTANVTYDLGSNERRWKDLWLANSTIYLGDAVLSANENVLLVNQQAVITGANANTISLSGNITGGNLSGSLITGTLTTAAQPNITSVGTLSSLTVTGASNYTGNIDVTGNINVTGNLNYDNVTDLVVGDPLIFIGANNTGNLFDLGIIVSWDDGLYQHGGWVRDASDGTWKLFGNVIPEPTTTVDFANAIYEPMLAGTVTAVGNISGNYFFGNGSQLTGISAGGGGIEWTTSATAPVGPNPGDFWYDTDDDKTYQYVNDGVGNAWVDQSAPTSFGNLTVGNILNGGANGDGNIGSATGYFNTTFATNGTFVNLSGNGAALTAINASNISSGTLPSARLSGTYTITVSGAATTAGTVTTAAQPNITSVGSLTTLTINTANVSGTSLEVYNVSSNTNAQLGLHATTGASNRQSKIKFYGTFFNTPGDVGERYVTSIRSGFDSSSTAWGSEFLGVYVNNTVNDTNSDANQTLIASFTNYKGLSVFKDITNGQANGVGNIGAAGATFNTVFAKATSAQYADLAENYLADRCYEPGTVVIFGGDAEVSVSPVSHDPRVAGVVSTNPSYLMNAALTGPTVAAVALTGRVPCWVQGPVSKGDRIVNAGAGIGGRLDRSAYEPGCIVGKSLEDITDDSTRLIEVVIGRF